VDFSTSLEESFTQGMQLWGESLCEQTGSDWGHNS